MDSSFVVHGVCSKSMRRKKSQLIMKQEEEVLGNSINNTITSMMINL